MNESIEQILEELYALDGGFKKHEVELRALLTDLVKTKPDVVVDQAFAQGLKAKLSAKADLLQTEARPSHPFFARFSALNLGLAVVALVAVASSAVLYQKAYGPISVENYTTTAQPASEVVAIGPNAFGKLGLIAEGGNGRGGGGAALNAPTETSQMDTVAKMAGGAGTDALIYPVRSYRYSYRGEAIQDLAVSIPVYRKNKNGFASQASSILSRLRLKAFNLKDFTNPRLDSITLTDESENGYTAYIDFQSSVLNLYQNYTRWNSDEKRCNYDPTCLAQARQGKTMAANEELIQIAQTFLKDQGVPMTAFAAPQVHESWVQALELSRSASPEYLPQDATVVFPRLVDGQEVRDESGFASGVMVTINVWSRQVTSASELGAFGVEKSEYAAETDTTRLIALAERGTYYNYPEYRDPNAEVVTVELGTPTRGLVRTWQTANDGSSGTELYVQALFFPVTNQKDTGYYGKYVVIPLAKDILDAANQNPPAQIMPLDGAVVK
ncbi:MAG: hypothetical protein KBD66_02115 [Candidatus Doudnabacteria bacterium]|nr:hypothetical protein [Candidatus Doudnabacteria bacterium]